MFEECKMNREQELENKFTVEKLVALRNKLERFNLSL